MKKNFSKRTRILAILALVLINITNIYSKNLDPRVIGSPAGPDGKLGNFSVRLESSYGTVSQELGEAFDVQHYQAQLGWVATDYITFLAGWDAALQDSTRHELFAGFRAYLKKPITNDALVNPDGLIGGLFFMLRVGARFSNSTNNSSDMVGDMELGLPVSDYLTMKAGCRVYEHIEATDVVGGYGAFHIYFARYPAQSKYINPDGPIGVLSLATTAGGSSEGKFSQVDFVLPISITATLHSVLRLDKTDFEKRTIYIAGLGISYYPAAR